MRARLESLLALLIAFATPTICPAKPNVLLICIDDLRPELGCYGVDYIQSPNIDRLAQTGRLFTRHYVQAPTCGASRYALLTGLYGPRSNQALFRRAEQIAANPASVPPSLPEWFRKNGYATVSVGKVSHHPGGLGGPDWNEDTVLELPGAWDRHTMPTGPWQHPRGAMHGLAHGAIRSNDAKMDVFESAEGPDTIYPDGWTLRTAIQELDTLSQNAQDSPFFLAVGIIRPHLPFGAPAKYFEPYAHAELPPIPHPEKPKGVSTWHRSSEFHRYNTWNRNPNIDAAFALDVRRHYAACVSYADTLMGQLLDRLSTNGVDQNTIVILWGDHGWHLGEHAVWGKHTLFEESLRSPLIIRIPEMDTPGVASGAMVETIDIFPTLCALAGLPTPDFLHGSSLTPHIEDPTLSGHPAYSYHGNRRSLRTDRYRLVLHESGDVELYDHQSSDGETHNIARSQPSLVKRLTELLNRFEERRKAHLSAFTN